MSIDSSGGRGPESAAARAAEDLGRSLSELIRESQKLRGTVDAAEVARVAELRAQRRIARIALGATLALVILVSLLVVITMQNNRLANQVNDTNARMADCTTPGGRCYTDSRARTGQAISDVIRASIFMAECARLYPNESGPEFDRKLEECVAERLAGPRLRASQPSSSPTPSGKG